MKQKLRCTRRGICFILWGSCSLFQVYYHTANGGFRYLRRKIMGIIITETVVNCKTSCIFFPFAYIYSPYKISVSVFFINSLCQLFQIYHIFLYFSLSYTVFTRKNRMPECGIVQNGESVKRRDFSPQTA